MTARVFTILFFFLGIIACGESENDNPSGETPDNFDRGTILVNLADNIIIPAYQDLDTKLTTLVTAKDGFVSNPNSSNLEILRSAWKNAYVTWQYVEMFDIGKAEEIQYNFQMNIYPTNITDIQNNIEAETTVDLTHPNNHDAVGFPALDYLLYGIGDTEAAILEKYTTDEKSEKYKNHLSDLTNQMQSLTEQILTDWTNSYRNTFVSSTENTATSAANKIVNDFIFYYEKALRAQKIGIPAGNFSTNPLPEKVEAFYNREISKELALESLKAVTDLFNGKHYDKNTSGTSFNNYLDYLDREDIKTTILSKLAAAKNKIEILGNNFFEQVNTDNTKMTEAYDALQTVVVLFKVDMLQAFNISVDYVDADGD